MLYLGSEGRDQSKEYYFIFTYFFCSFCCFSSKDSCFRHFRFFGWWRIQFWEPNINHSKTRTGDKKLSVKMYNYIIFYHVTQCKRRTRYATKNDDSRAIIEKTRLNTLKNVLTTFRTWKANQNVDCFGGECHPVLDVISQIYQKYPKISSKAFSRFGICWKNMCTYTTIS